MSTNNIDINYLQIPQQITGEAHLLVTRSHKYQIKFLIVVSLIICLPAVLPTSTCH